MAHHSYNLSLILVVGPPTNGHWQDATKGRLQMIAAQPDFSIFGVA